MVADVFFIRPLKDMLSFLPRTLPPSHVLFLLILVPRCDRRLKQAHFLPLALRGDDGGSFFRLPPQPPSWLYPISGNVVDYLQQAGTRRAVQLAYIFSWYDDIYNMYYTSASYGFVSPLCCPASGQGAVTGVAPPPENVSFFIEQRVQDSRCS